MEIINKKIQSYMEEYSSPEPDLLKRLNRETYTNMLFPRMLSGHHQGRILSFISKMINPRSILEIGTYTGYSALCLAEGLRVGGMLHTIEINKEFEGLARKYFKESGFSKSIIQYFGNALEIIPDLHEVFDLVFIDADKENYTAYYEQVLELMNSSGIILADNVLWSGKVIDPEQNDKDTCALRQFNDYVLRDNRVENVCFPIRDGIMLIRKI
ncbi:O-methyltransferase [Bacteroidota bacterium]